MCSPTDVRRRLDRSRRCLPAADAREESQSGTASSGKGSGEGGRHADAIQKGPIPPACVSRISDETKSVPISGALSVTSIRRSSSHLSATAEEVGSSPAAKKPRRRSSRHSAAKNQHLRHFVLHDYHDHSKDSKDMSDNGESALRGGRKTTPSSPSFGDNASHRGDRSSSRSNSSKDHPRGGVMEPFPIKLHALLEKVEDEGYGDIISWKPHGRCFLVHKPKDFAEKVMKKYFKQKKLTSFQRQLNLYGFQRITSGTDKGSYYHELFLRGMPFLCKRMVRIRIKGTGIKGASNPEMEPNFYAMPSVTDTTHRPNAKTAGTPSPPPTTLLSRSSRSSSLTEQEKPMLPKSCKEKKPRDTASQAYPSVASASSRSVSTVSSGKGHCSSKTAAKKTLKKPRGRRPRRAKPRDALSSSVPRAVIIPTSPVQGLMPKEEPPQQVPPFYSDAPRSPISQGSHDTSWPTVPRSKPVGRSRPFQSYRGTDRSHMQSDDSMQANLPRLLPQGPDSFDQTSPRVEPEENMEPLPFKNEADGQAHQARDDVHSEDSVSFEGKHFHYLDSFVHSQQSQERAMEFIPRRPFLVAPEVSMPPPVLGKESTNYPFEIKNQTNSSAKQGRRISLCGSEHDEDTNERRTTSQSKSSSICSSYDPIRSLQRATLQSEISHDSVQGLQRIPSQSLSSHDPIQCAQRSTSQSKPPHARDPMQGLLNEQGRLFQSDQIITKDFFDSIGLSLDIDHMNLEIKDDAELGFLLEEMLE